MHIMQSRRDFLATFSTASAAGVLGVRGSLADEGPPEVTTIRLRRDPSICVAPWYIAEDLLRAEGFSDIRYVPVQAGPPDRSDDRPAARSISASISPATLVFRLDEGLPITVLTGVHTGCFELFAHEPIRTISDLKGKRVGIDFLGAGKHRYRDHHGGTASGLIPTEDIEWVATGTERHDPMELFAEGKVDAFLGFPPEPQELRARKIGRVILNTTTDKPWSQYFCCMICGKRGVRPRSSRRYQARPASHAQSQRHLRRRAGAGRTAAGRSRVH